MKRTESTAETIKNWIVEHALQPGDRLPSEQALMQEFQVSKGTVRESMRLLEAQGIVKTRTGPNGGAFVHEVSDDRAKALLSNYFYFKSLSIDDIYQVRYLLEPEMAYHLTGKLMTEQLKQLEQHIGTYQSPAGSIEAERQQHIASLRFHEMLAEWSGNALLGFIIGFMSRVLSELTVYRRLYEPPNLGLWRSGLQHHLDLVQAFRDEHPDDARRIMQEHMEMARQFMRNQEAEVVRRFMSEC